MIIINTIIISGRLTKDVDLRYLNNGTATARFTVAVDRELSKEKKEEMANQGKATADFINVVVWGKQAETVANYLSKGSKALVKGRITTGSYETENKEKRYTTDVTAERVEFLDSKTKLGDITDKDLPSASFFEDIDSDDFPL